MKLDSIPVGFKPYTTLVCAGNKLINGVAFIAVNHNIPLLIGKAATPEVWIDIPVNISGEKWQPLVRKNRSLHTDVLVDVTDNKVTVNTPDGIVVEVVTNGENIAEISKLDLRPFGINLFLKDSVLNVMTNKVYGNTVQGAKIMIGVG